MTGGNIIPPKAQKVEARKNIVEALNTLDFGGKIRTFRHNNILTRFRTQYHVDNLDSIGRIRCA